jgi:hypothetical protein
MKYLKQKDIEDIKKFHEQSPQAKMIRDYHSWKFNVDDVLIRHSTDHDGNKVVDIVSESCRVPKKFRVVKVDELGIPWVKQLSVRGGLGNKLYCLMNYVNNYTWEVDPEQIDAVLLGYKYDPRAEYRRMRDENPQYGGKK